MGAGDGAVRTPSADRLIAVSAVRSGGKLRLPRQVDTAEALQRISGAALAHLLANAPAAGAGDAEGVHQMRVALRRQRAAMALFAPLLEAPAAPAAAGLRRLGRVFGSARDWDVFCLRTLPHAIRELPLVDSLHLLAQAAGPRRQAAHWRMQEELEGRDLGGVVLLLAAWSEGAAAAPLPGRSGAKPMRTLAPRLLHRLAAKVARRGSHMRRRSGAELHRLRKSLKKLRYGAEDLAGLYDRKRTRSYLRRCKQVLDLLGAINDAAVTERLSGELGRDGAAELAPALAALGRWNDARREQSLRRLEKAWTRLREASPFWS